MSPDSLPQLIDALLRLPLLQPAEIKDLIQNLANPQASAQELLRRGWITQDQFASAFPRPEKNRETLVVGFGDDDAPLDADSDNWDLLPGDEELAAEQKPVAESAAPAQPDEIDFSQSQAGAAPPVLSDAVAAPDFEWQMLPAAEGKKHPRRENDTDRLLRKWMGWASKGMLIWLFFLGSFVAGQRFFAAERHPSPGPAALKQSTKVRAPTDQVVRANKTPNPNRQPAQAQLVKKEQAPDAKVVEEPPVPDGGPVIIEQQFPPIEISPAPNEQQANYPAPQHPAVPAGLPGSGGVMVMTPRMPSARMQNTNTYPVQPAHSAGVARTSASHGSGHRSR